LTPWNPKVPSEEQPRYVSSTNCVYWPIFESLNDWQIIDTMPKVSNDEEEVMLAHNDALSTIAESMRGEISIGNIGAFATEDEATDGYYLVQWTGLPYELLSDREINEFEPPLIIRKGQLVCEASYYHMVPAGPRRWYTPMADYAVTVRLQLVYATNLELQEISLNHPLPNNWSRRIKTFAIEHNAKAISDHDHLQIQRAIERRELIDHEEDIFNDVEEEEEDLDEEAEDEDADSDDEVENEIG
jgi:hypothetical protein